ncbi:MAG: hypothetical protein JW779_15920 [Candidatus Thorarchaeota archaeon]|nr:hypothetical protein [Candidatus Thorarchaeota archaeon]
MSEQVGNKNIDAVFGASTISLLVFGIIFILGLGEFTTVVLFIFWPLVGTLWVVTFIIFLFSRVNKSREENLDLDEILEEVQETIYEPTPDTSFVIPSFCPYCREPVILEEIDWIRSDEFLCRFCGKTISVKIK